MTRTADVVHMMAAGRASAKVSRRADHHEDERTAIDAPLLLPQRPVRNEASAFTRKILRAEMALGDPKLWADYELLVQGHAIYLPNFFCDKSDYSLMKGSATDLEAHLDVGMINWSKHFIHENPTFSPTFRRIVATMSQYFDLDVYATRLNFYPDNTSWKPFHHDSHAYGTKNLREDLTVGASFGMTRALVFKHIASTQQFDFPQTNGDIFAFTTKVNTQFQHGVPKESAVKTGPRFSIIAWCVSATGLAVEGWVGKLCPPPPPRLTRPHPSPFLLHVSSGGGGASSRSRMGARTSWGRAIGPRTTRGMLRRAAGTARRRRGRLPTKDRPFPRQSWPDSSPPLCSRRRGTRRHASPLRRQPQPHPQMASDDAVLAFREAGPPVQLQAQTAVGVAPAAALEGV